MVVTKRTKNEQDILKLILKEIKKDVSEIKKDVAILKEDVKVLKEDVALIKRCPTVARELKELQANS